MNLVPCALISRTASGADSFGDDTFTETVTMTAGLFFPGGSSELTAAQDQVTTQPTECLPADVSVSAVDYLVPDVLVDSNGAPVLDGSGNVQGTRYEVDGDPQVLPASPWSGWRPDLPIVVRLRKATG